MPNFGSTDRTIIAVWSKERGERLRQYALWSSGEVITRLVGIPRISEWRPRTKVSIRDGLYHTIVVVNRAMKRGGYHLDYHTPRSALEVAK